MPMPAAADDHMRTQSLDDQVHQREEIQALYI
jgi:hypothetical protein